MYYLAYYPRELLGGFIYVGGLSERKLDKVAAYLNLINIRWEAGQ